MTPYFRERALAHAGFFFGRGPTQSTVYSTYLVYQKDRLNHNELQTSILNACVGLVGLVGLLTTLASIKRLLYEKGAHMR